VVGGIYVDAGGLFDINGQVENTDFLELYGNAAVQTGSGYLKPENWRQHWRLSRIQQRSRNNHRQHSLDPGKPPDQRRQRHRSWPGGVRRHERVQPRGVN